jgi:hypothetical protein
MIEPTRIHPLDFAKMINDTPVSEVLHVWIHPETLERVFSFLGFGLTYIQDANVPRTGKDIQ